MSFILCRNYDSMKSSLIFFIIIHKSTLDQLRLRAHTRPDSAIFAGEDSASSRLIVQLAIISIINYAENSKKT